MCNKDKHEFFVLIRKLITLNTSAERLVQHQAFIITSRRDNRGHAGGINTGYQLRKVFFEISRRSFQNLKTFKPFLQVMSMNFSGSQVAKHFTITPFIKLSSSGNLFVICLNHM